MMFGEYGRTWKWAVPGLGADVQPLESIPHVRAWIFAPLHSPLHSQCYVDAVAKLTATDPVFVVDDSDWLYSGVWLVNSDTRVGILDGNLPYKP
jgi:hypothetical protein